MACWLERQQKNQQTRRLEPQAKNSQACAIFYRLGAGELINKLQVTALCIGFSKGSITATICQLGLNTC